MDIISFVLGLILGGATAFAVSYLLYERARSKLKVEVSKLRDLNVKILRHMEDAGLIIWNRDSRGRIIGLNIRSKSDAGTDEETFDRKTLH